MKKREKHINKKKKMAIRYISLTLATVCIIGTFVWAKFYSEKHAQSDNIPSVATYYFDVVGNDTTQKLSEQIDIGQINPGETRTIDFYVRNGNGTQFSQVNMNYKIKLIHTDNLPFKYELYDYEGNLISGNDENSTTTDNINDGSSTTYQVNSEGNPFVLDIGKINVNEGTMDSQHYTLKIVWNRASSDDIDFKYVKDLDLIYLNIEAYEEEPHD